jgi:DNA helicase-2/ATP-dependent DNA helicase PcrA
MLPIITVHQAKGAEFQVVFLAGASANHFPNYYGDPEEEKRIFYVAVTRAKERLFITYASRNDNGFSQTPSPYLDLLPSKDVLWD